MKIRAAYILAVLAVTVLAALAQSPEEIFMKGNEYYRAGRFEEAAKEYESIVRQGYASGPVLFNLGNACFRSGKIAQAILWFERAARIEPGDRDIEFNLRLASSRIVDRIEPLPELFLLTWIRSLAALASLSTSLILLLIAWILVFGQLALVNLLGASSWTAAFRWGILVSLILVVVLGFVVGVQVSEVSDRSEAIIVVRSVTAKNSPDVQSVDAFVIHEGLKVRVDDRVGDWMRITLVDGKVGWIRSAECERI
ncbi:MAG TPA: tetratricopeptide repeat protein [Bacteroidota bacterium]|nr:tetratricopeptide repeat protein [Bacteroidota bacterium]